MLFQFIIQTLPDGTKFSKASMILRKLLSDRSAQPEENSRESLEFENSILENLNIDDTKRSDQPSDDVEVNEAKESAYDAND